uniref:Xylanase inhibitor N-terminal domain-containing protein n=1 Tax=Lactuca sativa TaxID=4236 RepID=A0A9R1XTX9_LACSA|nr:hypothetical protein LSAT_V11C100041520 [Lactuca sativa]
MWWSTINYYDKGEERREIRIPVSIIVKNRVTSTLLYLLLLHAVDVLSRFPATLSQERAFPQNHRIELSQLRDRDSLRHSRILNKYYDPWGVVAFAILGTYDLPVVWWHYIINLESISVNGQTLVFSLNYNKGNNKYTLCSMTLQAPQHVLIMGALTISTLKMGFGYSTFETRYFIKTNRPVDGVLGLGQQGISIISEISSQGIAPNSFTHCLVGDGGGLLVLGTPIMPDIVFTPLVKSK